MSIRKTYGFHLITGNVPGAMDAVDGDDLNNGDRAQVYNGGDYSAYELNAASGAVADGVDIVEPATNAGTKRWVRQGFAGVSYLLLGETSITAYRGDRGKTAYEHSQATHTVAQGGTGRTTLTAGSFIRGAGTTEVTMSTATQATAALDVATVALKGLQSAADKQTFDDEQTIKSIINPTLDLNFGQQEYKSYVDHLGLVSWPLVGGDTKVTFTRTGTGGGTYFDAMGGIQQAGEDDPRIDYDPVTGECLGLLIEEQRTNLLTDSLLDGKELSDMDYTVTEVAHTLSFYGTGTVTLSGTHAATVVGLGAAPTRTTLTFTPTAGTLELRVSGMVQWANLEIGSFATSFIPTDQIAVTRSADVCSITSTNFSEWYRQGVGTVVCEGLAGSGTRPTLFCISAATTAERFRINRNATLATTASMFAFFITYSGGTLLSITTIAATSTRFAIALESENYAVSADSILHTNSAAGTFTPDRLFIGSQLGAEFINGHIKHLTFYPQRLTNTELQALTRG